MGVQGTQVLAASSARFNFFLIGSPQTLRMPTLSRATLDRAFAETEFPRIAKVSRWRTYSGLKPAEKRQVRQRYERGDLIQSIASQLAVYAGDVAEAARLGGWKRGGKPTKAQRLRQLLKADPSATLERLAELAECSITYVRFVRHEVAAEGGAK